MQHHRTSIPVDKGVILFRRSDSPCWYICIHRGGRRTVQSLHTRDKHHGLLIARQRAEELLSLRNQVIVSRDPLVDDMVTDFNRHLALRTTPGNQRLSVDNLTRVLTFIRERVGRHRLLRLSDFSPEALETYMEQRKAAGISAGTINRERGTLHALFRRAARRRLIRSNPVELIEPLPDVRKSIPKTLSPDQVDRLLTKAASPVPFHGRGRKGTGNSRARYTPLHDMILFALNTGARLGELLHLEWNDVKMEQSIVQLVNKAQHQTKDRQDRAVGLNHLVTEMLRRRAVQRDPNVSWVFPSLAGGVIERRNALREFKVVAEKAEVPDANFLILRHSALTAIARSGVPPFVLKEIAGHSSLRTTERFYVGCLGGAGWLPPALGRPCWVVQPVSDGRGDESKS